MTVKINFITNQSLDSTSGGWSGISASTFHQIGAKFETEYIGPIDPPTPLMERGVSRISRALGRTGALPVFGEKRLMQIEREWRTRRCDNAMFDFFHGATPWSLCRPRVPYACYIDATVRQYFEIYTNAKAFSKAEIDRIESIEGEWMRGAAAVFFGSSWMRDIAIQSYGLSLEKCHTIWTGGNLSVPEQDLYSGRKRFLFIALRFEEKGGRVAVEAFKKIRSEFPNAELLILGQEPPSDVLENDGVEYGGMLRKTIPKEEREFREIVSEAFALVHPTSMDANPLVLIEVGYYGCPSISTRRFGIPELVLHDQTGLLIDLPIKVEQVADHMRRMLVESKWYGDLRKNVREDTSSRLTWDSFGDRVCGVISSVLDVHPNSLADQKVVT